MDITPKELGIIFIIAAIVIAFLYAKMILIWCDVMIKENEKIKSNETNNNNNTSPTRNHHNNDPTMAKADRGGTDSRNGTNRHDTPS